MDTGRHHPSTYDYHDDYRFLPAAGELTGGTDILLLLAVPAGWLIRLVAFLGERVISAVLTLVGIPVAAVVGELRAVPATASSLARRAAVGLLAAAFTFAALASVFVLSLLLGFALVRHCVDDPVTVRQPLYFDYTEPQPSAAVALGGGWGAAAPLLPGGHFVTVSLTLILPDSDHNRQIGVFQIKAEAIAPSGTTIVSTTQPYMLRYKSTPVRLAQSALTIVPLVMGVRSESQSATLKMLQYREGHGRHKKTGRIRVFLQPRALTVHLPQVYRAEITVQTSLPWLKAMARSLKWTMCVWISFCIYVILSVFAVYWVRTLVLSAWQWDMRLSDHQVKGKTTANLGRRDKGQSSHEEPSRGVVKWRDRRGKRKAQEALHDPMVELKLDEGSASTAAAVETDEVIDGDHGESHTARSAVFMSS
ncbi:seipin-1 [Lolium perenne]|uniref:seipin-1 n=1 Tax=Lolium perenne TaxID=4522 RepID=UPI0021F64506|nr:seipin-1 [Lolium perenne]